MFETFHDRILSWLEQANRIEEIRRLYQPILSLKERHPDTRTLWDRLLRSLIARNRQHFFFHHPYRFEGAVSEFSQLGPYTRRQKIETLTYRYLSSFSDDSHLEALIDFIHQFLEQIHSWEDGYWHRQIQKDRFGMVPRFSRLSGFNSEWQAAAFLSSCGYQIPSSRHAAEAWCRYSGQEMTRITWTDWLTQLRRVAEDDRSIYTADFILEKVFGPWAVQGIPPFCADTTVCCGCPLQTDCKAYQTQIAQNDRVKLEKLIRVDGASEIEMSNLIIYLAGDRWTGSPYQASLLAQYLENRDFPVTDRPPEHGDEQFLLFLKALRLTSASLSPKMAVGDDMVFNKSQLVYEMLRPMVQNLKQEAFFTLILDNRYRQIHCGEVTRGILNRSLIHPREVFSPAIQLRAAAVILVHNHPSGDPQPSTQDIEITKRLAEAGKIVGIEVVDHVIIGEETYFSFVDEALL